MSQKTVKPVDDPIETKPITQAQGQELQQLVSEYQLAEANLNRFVAYLRREYDVNPADGWTNVNATLGFVRTKE